MKRKMVLLGAFALVLTLNLKLSSNVNSNSKTDKGISSICSNVMAKAEDDDDDDDEGEGGEGEGGKEGEGGEGEGGKEGEGGEGGEGGSDSDEPIDGGQYGGDVIINGPSSSHTGYDYGSLIHYVGFGGSDTFGGDTSGDIPLGGDNPNSDILMPPFILMIIDWLSGASGSSNTDNDAPPKPPTNVWKIRPEGYIEEEVTESAYVSKIGGTFKGYGVEVDGSTGKRTVKGIYTYTKDICRKGGYDECPPGFQKW